jgi:hypothetical protein
LPDPRSASIRLHLTSPNNALMNIRIFFLLFSIVLASAGPIPAQELNGKRLLFVGNSITLHGPAEQIGWAGNWGMAASAEEKDYVHLVVDSVAKRLGTKPEFRVVNLAEFERNYANFDAAGRLKEELAFQADTVIVALGENVPALKTDETKAKFTESAVRLLTRLKREGQSALYVRSCFWPDAAKDAALKEACATNGGIFVDIAALGKDEKNYARSERKIAHAGVAAHPGDKGMRAIADAIFAAMEKTWK